MNLTHCLREIEGDGQDFPGLTEETARRLFAAMLDGGVPDLELGAILAALHFKGETLTELAGFYQALDERTCRLHRPDSRIWPVVLGSYGGTLLQPNLLPLLALLLRRFGIPVLIHGTLQSDGRLASALVFRELGVMPCATLGETERRLEQDRIAFVPTPVLSPGLAALMALRSRLGNPNPAHFLARFLDPFDGGGLRVIGFDPYAARNGRGPIPWHGWAWSAVAGSGWRAADPVQAAAGVFPGRYGAGAVRGGIRLHAARIPVPAGPIPVPRRSGSAGRWRERRCRRPSW